MVEGQLISTHGECLYLFDVDGLCAVEDGLCTTWTGVDVQSSSMGCRGRCLHIVLLLGLYGEGGPHGVAVVLAGFYYISALAQL